MKKPTLWDQIRKVNIGVWLLLFFALLLGGAVVTGAIFAFLEDEAGAGYGILLFGLLILSIPALSIYSVISNWRGAVKKQEAVQTPPPAKPTPEKILSRDFVRQLLKASGKGRAIFFAIATGVLASFTTVPALLRDEYFEDVWFLVLAPVIPLALTLVSIIRYHQKAAYRIKRDVLVKIEDNHVSDDVGSHTDKLYYFEAHGIYNWSNHIIPCHMDDLPRSAGQYLQAVYILYRGRSRRIVGVYNADTWKLP